MFHVASVGASVGASIEAFEWAGLLWELSYEFLYGAPREASIGTSWKALIGAFRGARIGASVR